MKNEVNSSLLKLLNTIESIEQFTHQKIYIWGGLALDIYKQTLLRPHHDVDCLMTNLNKNRKSLKDFLNKLGYTDLKDLENKDVSAKYKENKLHIGNIFIKDNEVEWTHNGDIESIYFPKSWLEKNKRKFMNQNLKIVSPKFELVIKTFPELLNPEWKGRKKDIQARNEWKKIVNISAKQLKAEVRTVTYK